MGRGGESAVALDDALLELLSDEVLGEDFGEGFGDAGRESGAQGESGAHAAERMRALDARLTAVERARLETAASSVAIALAESEGLRGLPLSVAASLSARGRAFAAEARRTASGNSGASATAQPRQALRLAGTSDSRADGAGNPTRRMPTLLPWFAAAAACVFAAIAWWPAGVPTPREQLLAVKAQPDARGAAWSDWAMNDQPPEVAGVAGEVVWSDAAQKGVMRFDGLPPCAKGRRYQLWIVDAERGFEQRISGGVFDGAPGELLVPFRPEIPVRKAAAFAVTIEAPDGTWVSDMKSRVVIAAVK
jgi:hypothetical protein